MTTKNKKLFVTEEQLINAITKCLREDLDSQQLADIGEQILGGRIYPDTSMEKFEVIVTETYGGAFD